MKRHSQEHRRSDRNAFRGDLDAAKSSYLEVVLDAYAASRLALKLHDAVATLYKA